MNKERFFRLMEDVFEFTPNTLTEDKLLTHLECWDSLSVLKFIAFADEHFGLTLSGEQVFRSQTVGDLYALLGGKNALKAA